MAISTEARFYGTRVIRADLEALLAKADPDPETVVNITVAPRYNSPTDPGGEISIRMRGRE